MRFVATAARGTEETLGEELRELGLGPVEERSGAVVFEGALVDGYRAVMWSRTASRVLLVLEEGDASDADGLYELVRSIDWAEHVGSGRTIAVDLARSGRTADNPRFLMLRVKDAVVDRLRDTRGERPDVDTRHPDVRVHVYVAAGRAAVSVDLSGAALHRRGHGRQGAAAPLKESLAAALLRMARWPSLAAEGRPLVDPMCGSGTFLLEAAAMALDRAPGLDRPGHGFDRWLGHDPAAWRVLVEEAEDRRAAAPAAPVIRGFDASERALSAARQNARAAGLPVSLTRADVVSLDSAAVETIAGSETGLVVVNPPYGERLGEVGELGLLYERLGDLLKHGFPGWTGWVLSGNRALDKRIGLRAASRRPVFNGPIECRWLELPIREAPARSEGGPGWRKPTEDAVMLENRLRKNRKRLGRWARREGITCWRLYDAEIPEYNLAVDLYEDAAVVQEQARPPSVDADVADAHLRDAMRVVPEVLGLPPTDVHLRVRQRRSASEQYEQRADRKRFREVREGGLRFLVNLTDYLDTGLFLDQRQVRAAIRDRAQGRAFLNLFAYTCTATVYAAAGGARTTTSVDLSNTYLDWGRENLALNGLDAPHHQLVRDDCLAWLEHHRGTYDLVFCAPPTWSRSKAMRDDFDVQRDHVALVRACARLLSADGILLFCPVKRDFELDLPALAGLRCEDLSRQTLPRDFERSARTHHTWRITRES